MKILFVSHQFHRRTGSNEFFKDILKTLGNVTARPDDSFEEHPKIPADLSDVHSFDMVIAWQVTEVAIACALKGVKNLVWVPMHDAGYAMNNLEILKTQARVICFCAAQYEELQRLGFKKERMIYVRYFPKPSKTPIQEFTSIRPFLWQRRFNPSWQFCLKLLRGIPYKEFNLHFRPDFEEAVIPEPTITEQKANRIHLTRWFDSKKQADENLAMSNLYFAPRTHEGIGMGFLDAMAMGMPVVAPDHATHNEYITQGYNGFLYGTIPNPLQNVTPSKLAEVSMNCRQTIARGYQIWLQDLEKIKQWLS